MRTTLFLLAAAFAFQSFCPPVRAGDAAPKTNFILIGWDGAQRAHVKEMLGAGKLPNLANLVKEGGLVETNVVTGPTQTKPGWAEILTGYSSGRLQISSNKEYRPIPKGYTVFERLKARFGGDITTIFITAKPYNLGARGPHEICSNANTRDPLTMLREYYLDRARFKGTTRDGKPPYWVRREGEPYFNAVKAVDYHYSQDSPAGTIGEKALAALEKYRKKPFFAFVHFREPDEQGHQFGENSAEYGEAIAGADLQLGKILEKLKQLGLYSKTVIFVTSDHGMDEGARVHKNAPFMVLAANRALGRASGDRKDVTPTILDWYGFDLGKISPPLDGRSLFLK